MRKTVYRYNVETCQYERVRVTARGVIWYLTGLGAMALCMLMGILLLHDLIINTPQEKSLRKENRALKKHHEILSDQLDDLQPMLASLQKKDKLLHEKFFGSKPLQEPAGVDRASKQDLLLADGSSFRAQVASLNNISRTLRVKSLRTSGYFGEKVTLKKNLAQNVHYFPTLPPLQSFESDQLISGFGMRVNPFHKGLYEHLGIDLAVPRGTPVIATASGTVAQLKRSDLQAGYGNYLEIDHGNGMITRYAHLEEISVRFGARVRKGDTIGTVGTSGGSVAPHLHYEVLREAVNEDPIYYMVEGLSPARHHYLTLLSHQQNQSLD